MGRYLLKIAYNGTAYHGWQVQPNGITVQQVLCEKISEIAGHNVSVIGCSRTDSGVHAKEFFCHFDCENNIPEKAFVYGLNSILPKDISALDCKTVSSDFHARYNCIGKRYVYNFFDGDVLLPFYSDFTYISPIKIDETKMNEFCSLLLGEHDFIAFSSSKRTVEDTVRTIFDAQAQREDDFVRLSVTGNGFLYNMVRIIAGTALRYSGSNCCVEDIKKALELKSREQLGATLPPQGLFLDKVFYKEEDLLGSL